MKVAISQPRYLPALNYFQRILIADVFVILDNVQHQRRAFEQRNKIKSTNGKGVWCSIPLKKESSRPLIITLKVKDLNWIEEHKQIITNFYQKAEFFDIDILNIIYENINSNDFVKIVMQITMNICELLNIEYNFVYASELNLKEKNDKLLYEITKGLQGNEYISGPNGRDYIDSTIFKDVKLLYHEYNFPTYKQINGEFIPWMSIIDQIFNIGIIKTKELIFKEPILKDK